VNIDEIDSCCTAKLLCGFGATTAALNPEDYDGRDIGEGKQALLKALLDMKQGGNAVVIAFTNNKQHKGNKLLREVGFKKTKWMKKSWHPETKLRLWWMPLAELEA
jgi:hypothetical protein